ncbi:MAG TPA: DegT/DnrJ/EryC1/StrS family aminotransferase [Anaerolineaceae bacterium]
MKSEKLAIDGGERAIRSELPKMYPGGMRIGSEEESAVIEVLRSKRLYRFYGPHLGPSKVDEFEAAFAGVMGSKYALAVSSGSAALMCGLAALGVGPGDEVVIPAYTWIATAEAVMAVGGVPVFAEVDDSLMVDPLDVEKKITPATKAIIPVHMRGLPCPMDRLVNTARRHGIKVLEDVAQADGGSYKGKHLGTWGDIGAFSFQFNKIITAGEGGAVITDDFDLYKRAMMYHDVGGGRRLKIPQEEILPGINVRMTEMQGAILSVQLTRLESLLADMRRNKRVLMNAVSESAEHCGAILTPCHDPEGDASVALIFMLPTSEMARKTASALKAEGAPASVLFDPAVVDYHVYYHWAPVINQRVWSEKGGPWRWNPNEVTYSQDMCPRTLSYLGRAVQVDVSPDLTDENLEELADAIQKVLSQVN